MNEENLTAASVAAGPASQILIGDMVSAAMGVQNRINHLLALREEANNLMRKLYTRKIALWVGHEPGGGAEGEREWNIKLARVMCGIASDFGADCRAFYHKIKPYEVALELHYDAVSRPGASGYHFQYVSDAGKA